MGPPVLKDVRGHQPPIPLGISATGNASVQILYAWERSRAVRCYAGKTTILRALLTQNKYRVGCIVNDVAAVNIDAKLIRNRTGGNDIKSSTADLAPTIELQNGCACVPLHKPLCMGSRLFR